MGDGCGKYGRMCDDMWDWTETEPVYKGSVVCGDDVLCPDCAAAYRALRDAYDKWADRGCRSDSDESDDMDAARHAIEQREGG